MPGCDKMFMTPLNLKSHLRTHNPDKPFACQEDGCDASFRRHHDLKRHMGSVHTCSRPFTCDRCEKVFARQDALKRHVTRPGTACYNSTSF
ncbi:hypothetical protein CXG81DRAFT_13002 [Caulochytrium protostelioides]|uniref:C2H2-type domain-containing protein n=1 Tax=Caulochytrium protostelioides TaxID=1555241 RepID=A0A4P9X611_9FUNG|nr:hypothetical protein CXG81DRAFT_13002 [Caulochytrium protostelioides]|eukprot:RKP00607.1 hypothetical protein CXG81DRAFT_13002 [Caulochytrium protostelioides]